MLFSIAFAILATTGDAGLQLDSKREDKWNKVFDACVSNYSSNLYNQGAHHKTGLIPDFLYFSGDPGPGVYGVPNGKVLEDNFKDTVYSYNACRC